MIPQISAVMGPCAGGAVYSPAITDFILMVEHSSYMFVTGPNVVKTVTNEEISSEDLGGAHAHASKSGVAQLTSANDVECIAQIKKLLAYLPQNCEERVPDLEYEAADERRPGLADLIPVSPNQPYDMKEIILSLVDDESFFEIHEEYAGNIIVGFARIAGRCIGVIANQPMVLAGCLDVNASKKVPDSSEPVIVSISLYWSLRMFQVSFLDRTRNGMGSSPMVPSCCMHSVRPQCRVYA